MHTLNLIDLLEFTPLVNFLRNDNSRCCYIKATKTENAHHERRIYGSRPAGRDTANVESTDPRRNLNLWNDSIGESRFGFPDSPFSRQTPDRAVDTKDEIYETSSGQSLVSSLSRRPSSAEESLEYAFLNPRKEKVGFYSQIPHSRGRRLTA